MTKAQREQKKQALAAKGRSAIAANPKILKVLHADAAKAGLKP